MGSDRPQQLSDERVNLIGNDSIEGTGFVLHVTVERRIGDVDQLRHTREVGCFVTLNRRSERSKARSVRSHRPVVSLPRMALK